MLLRPSSAKQWVNCPGYASLARFNGPSQDTDPARQGTCAAWVAEMVFTGQVATCADLLGAQHENGWIVEPDMVRHIQAYVDLLRSFGGDVIAEQRVSLIDNLIEGTPDACVINGSTLRVIDLKYGFEIVEPTTPQVLIYAAAIAKNMPHIQTIILGIYQPRAAHPSGIFRTITLDRAEFDRRVQRIIEAAYATQDPNALCKAGDWCRRCDSAARCSAVAHEVYRAVSTMQVSEQRDMTPTEIAEELAFLSMAEELMKGRRDAIIAEAEARMNRGENIPGWHWESGYGHRKWVVGADVIRMLTGIDPTNGKMVTPAELERMGADPDLVGKLSKAPRLKSKLKPIPQGYLASKFGG